jgi:hypothetical protein
VRKYQLLGWPLFLGIICDCSLSDLDHIFYDVVDEAEKLKMFEQDIQNVRNFVGLLSDRLAAHYNKVKRGSVEGIAILWAVDKMVCSSLLGDHMVHGMCRSEFYSIVNTMPHM